MNGQTPTMLAAALEYARLGLSVFPLHHVVNGLCSCGRCTPGTRNAGKHPIGKLAPNGFLNATADPKLIGAWWEDSPNANIGIATGKVSGVSVLDVDPRNGGDATLDKLTKDTPLPNTPQVLTGGGGVHYYFSYQAGLPSKLGDGLDVKSDGGYVVAPPSNHLLGTYEWEGSSEPDQVPFAVWPELLNGISERKVKREPVGSISEGGRDNHLTAQAGAMRRRGMSETTILAALRAENDERCVPPLTESDLRRIARSVGRYPPGDGRRPEEPPVATYEAEAPEGWTTPTRGRIHEPLGEPRPLVAKVEPEAYPLDALPGAVRKAVEEVQSFTKAPIPLVASSAQSSLSLAAQAHIDVKRAERLQGPTGLFSMVIADSGERKSTCDGFFMTAVRDYEEEQAEAAAPELKRHKANIAAWTAKHEGIRAKIRDLAKAQKSTGGMELALRELEKDKPEPPRIPRLLYADATPEALAYGLAKKWPACAAWYPRRGGLFSVRMAWARTALCGTWPSSTNYGTGTACILTGGLRIPSPSKARG